MLGLIWLTMLVAYLDRINISVAGPSMMADLHIGKTQFGLVLSAFTLGYAVMQAPGGLLADRFGSKPLLVVAILLWSAFTALTGAVVGLASLLVVRVLFGVGEGCENGAQFKLIGDNFNERERSKANSIFLSALALGPAIGTPLAAWALGKYGWRELFFGFSAIGVIVSLILWRFLNDGRSQEMVQEAKSQATTGFPIWKATFWLCFLAYLLFNCAFWGFLGWIPTYLSSERHFSLSELGLLGALPYFAGFLGALLVGQLGTSIPERRPILVGACFGFAAAFLYAAFLVVGQGACIACLSLAAFFLFGSFGPFWAMALGFAPASTRGGFTGFVNLGGQIGGFGAQIAIGWLAQSMKSFQGAFAFMAAALILAALVTMPINNRTSMVVA